MKVKITFVAAIFLMMNVSCKNTKTYDCSKEIEEENIGFMLHGGILDAYDNGRVFVSIVHVANPKDWQYNEYFTGEGFSKNKDEELQVIEGDSCQLKQKYFEYLDKE